MYLKILNEKENHNDLQYKTGVNEDPLPWDSNTNCKSGGIYFSDGKHICGFLSYGPYIRQVKLLKDSKISHGYNKSKASKVWLGKRRDLSKISTWRWMVKSGVDIHAKNDYALIWASESGHLKVVKYLVEQGADIHAYGDYALKWASANGHLEVVKYLVEQGANIHACNNGALRWASVRGHIKVVKYLVKQGANIHAYNDHALRWASANGRLKVVKFLKGCIIQEGKPIYFKILNEEENHNGLQYKTGVNTDPLPWDPDVNCEPGGIYFSNDRHICEFLSYGSYIRQVKLLKDSKVSHGDNKSKASKVWLGKRRDLSKVSTWRWMVKNGVDVRVKSNHALRRVSESGHLKVVKYLVGQGADIHACGDYALKWASANGHLEVIKYLVKQGADIHASNNHAFKWASARGHLKVVKFLKSCK